MGLSFLERVVTNNLQSAGKNRSTEPLQAKALFNRRGYKFPGLIILRSYRCKGPTFHGGPLKLNLINGLIIDTIYVIYVLNEAI